MDFLYLANFHVCNSSVEALYHLACAADELQRFSAVVGRVELGAVVEGSAVVGAAGLADVLSADAVSVVAAVSALVSAFMAFSVLMLSVVIAVGAGVLELSPEVSLNSLVRASACACAKLYAAVLQSSNRSRSYAAADQNVYSPILQQSSQSLVACAVRAHDLRGDYFSVLNIVYLKLFGVSEMLEHIAVFISYSYLHLDLRVMQYFCHIRTFIISPSCSMVKQAGTF